MSEMGVLLPVRLETRVDQDGAGAWQLRLRVIPDEASILRHRESVSSAEWDLLAKFWSAFDGSTAGPTPAADWLASSTGSAAWADFALALGGPRACYLAVAFRPTIFDANGKPVLTPPANRDQAPLPNRVNGFPAKLAVWAVFQGQPPVLLATQAVASDKLVLRPLSDPLRPKQPPDPMDPEATDGREEWWSSWNEAVKLGLAIACPLQGTPQTLVALYVVGLGDVRPIEHFNGRCNAGDMAILAAGTPTNTVQGKPAASLDLGPDVWFQVALRQLKGEHATANRVLGMVLSGKPDALPALPGDSNDDARLGKALVSGLWSALWGHALRDIWGLGPLAEQTGQWAAKYLYPEGPLPPIRLSDQPYGVLPTTSLTRWKPNAADLTFVDCEEPMARLLATLRGKWATAARLAGNVVGASTERLLDLLGCDGVTTRYGSRRFLEDSLLELLYAVNPPFNNAAFRHKLEDWVRPIAFQATQDVGRKPAHYFLGYGGYRGLGLPLVKPLRKPAHPLEEMFQDLLAMVPNSFHEKYPSLPASLLIRLLVWAGSYNRAAVALEADPSLAGVLAGGLLVEPPTVNDRTINGTPFAAAVTELDRLILTSPNPPSSPPARAILNLLRAALKPILAVFANLDLELPRLERIFRATLDSAMVRLDPWVMGLAWHRLEQLGQDPGTRRRLGVYGWVDGPILGNPGPTDGGLLHTPSHGQAIMAVILRDKYLSDRQEAPPPARNAWTMKLASKPIREADALADEVRLGAHLWEVVGRQVERVVGTTDAVNKLRGQFPMQNDRTDAAVVCHGLDALKALLAGPVPGIALTQSQKDRLADLQNALDVYGDLLVCEAVYQVVHGKGDAAGAAMDAAVGLQRPPELQFVETARQGRSLHTSVLCAFPLRNPPAVVAADTSPGLLADPSVAAVLVELFGEAVEWTWETVALPVVRVTLADLGLSPVDALALGSESLTALARAAGGIADDQALNGTALEKHRQARQFVQAVGRHPCLWRDLARVGPSDPAPADVAARDDSLRAELLGRYNTLKTAATALQAALTAAADDAGRRASLRRAVCWGIVPSLADAPPAAMLRAIYADTPAADELALLPAAATAAAAALASRLRTASTPPNDQPRNVAQIAAAIAELASPSGTLAILSSMDRGELLARSGVRPDLTVSLAANWLSTVAAVRPPMARFEAWQLEGETLDSFSPLSARSNNDDPWLKAALQANEQSKDLVGGLQFPRFVAAYGTATTWNAATTKFAVGLIDAWGEAAPTRAHTTSAAFGFNAPAARAPQAILLAAPPVADQPLDDETLRDIVIETRELAHARAVALEQLGAFQALTPLAMLPGTGTSAFRTTP